MLLKRISHLFLMIHEFLLLIFEKDPPIDSEYECGGIVLTIVVILREGLFWREGLSLKFGAEQ